MKNAFRNTALQQVLQNHFEMEDVIIYEAILGIMEVTPALEVPGAVEAYLNLIGHDEQIRFCAAVSQPSPDYPGLTRQQAADLQLAELSYAEKQQQVEILDACLEAHAIHKANRRARLATVANKRLLAENKVKSARWALEAAARSYVRVLDCGDLAVITAAKENCSRMRARYDACQILYNAAYAELEEIVQQVVVLA